jgi:hypothetical protein
MVEVTHSDKLTCLLLKWNSEHTLKNVNNYLNANIYSYLMVVKVLICI